MDPTCIRAWDEDVPSPKLLVRVYNLNADTSAPERIQTIITAMKNIIMGIEYDLPQINPPAVKIALSTRVPDAEAAPSSFLIYNIPSDISNILFRTRIWSTPDITFEVWNFDPVFPLFMFSLDGFITNNEEDMLSIVQRAWESPRVRTDIVRTLATDPECLTPPTPWHTTSTYPMLSTASPRPSAYSTST
jgi:hypothetical protein